MLGIMRRTRTDRTWATVVALALLLHTFVAGIVGGALAAPSHAGVFGIICSAHRESDPPAVPGHHSHMPECCLVGCPAVGGHAALSAPVDLPQPSLTGRPVAFAPGCAGVGYATRRSPFSPRAPPLAV